MDETENGVRVVALLLLIASGVAMLTKWIRVPYTLALVIVGLIIAPMHFLPSVHISPELILLIFLPALLFEAAWNLDLQHFRRNLTPVLLLASVGVAISTAVVAAVLHFGPGFAWPSALLFGSMISATDPVSVLALFRRFGLPDRLTTIVEGESLWNDGMAAVLFRIVLAVAVAANVPDVGELIAGSAREFVTVVFGGLAVGLTVGLVTSKLTSWFDDHLLEITLTTIAAWGPYLISEAVHVSGVIAVLTSGMVLGNYGRRTGMSATTQNAIRSFWEYAAFVANSLVFLLIGLDVRLDDLTAIAPWAGWAIGATLLGRLAAVYLLLPASNAITEPAPLRWGHVLFWGGLRGSLSIALALSVPASVTDRRLLVSMVFAVVLFSLLGQGLTLGPLLRRLGFQNRNADIEEAESLLARMACEEAALRRLREHQKAGLLPRSSFDRLSNEVERSRELFGQRLLDIRERSEAVRRNQDKYLARTLTESRRAQLDRLRRNGLVSDDVARKVAEEFDRGDAD